MFFVGMYIKRGDFLKISEILVLRDEISYAIAAQDEYVLAHLCGTVKDWAQDLLIEGSTRKKVIFCWAFPQQVSVLAESIIGDNDLVYLVMFLRQQASRLNSRDLHWALDQLAKHRDSKVIYECFVDLPEGVQQECALHVGRILQSLQDYTWMRRFWYYVLEVLELRDPAFLRVLHDSCIFEYELAEWVRWDRELSDRILAETRGLRFQHDPNSMQHPFGIVLKDVPPDTTTEKMVANLVNPDGTTQAHFFVSADGRVVQLEDVSHNHQYSFSKSEQDDDCLYFADIVARGLAAMSPVVVIAREQTADYRGVQRTALEELIVALAEDYGIPLDDERIAHEAQLLPLLCEKSGVELPISLPFEAQRNAEITIM